MLSRASVSRSFFKHPWVRDPFLTDAPMCAFQPQNSKHMIQIADQPMNIKKKGISVFEGPEACSMQQCNLWKIFKNINMSPLPQKT